MTTVSGEVIALVGFATATAGTAVKIWMTMNSRDEAVRQYAENHVDSLRKECDQRRTDMEARFNALEQRLAREYAPTKRLVDSEDKLVRAIESLRREISERDKAAINTAKALTEVTARLGAMEKMLEMFIQANISGKKAPNG